MNSFNYDNVLRNYELFISILHFETMIYEKKELSTSDSEYDNVMNNIITIVNAYASTISIYIYYLLL